VNPVRKAAFKRSNLVFYYILVLSVIIMKILEIFPRQSLILTIIGITFDLSSTFMHMILSIIDPGRIRNEGIEFLKLLESFDA